MAELSVPSSAFIGSGNEFDARPANGQDTGGGESTMRAKRTKVSLPPPPDPAEVSTSDRAVLAGAYQAGLITAWKRDAERGYRLTPAGRQDEYVEVTKLTSYLERLRGAA